MEDLLKKNEILNSEILSLKNSLEQLNLEKACLKQTIYDILEANLNLKLNGAILDKNINIIKGFVTTKDKEIENLNVKIAQLSF